MNRLTIILDKIQVLLGGYEPVIQVVEHYVDMKEEVEYLYLRVLFPQLVFLFHELVYLPSRA